MILRFCRILEVSVLAAAALFVVGAAAEPTPAAKTLSPYFVVEGGDPKQDSLPLESTRVEVDVSNVIADVTVTQVYENLGKRPIHAEYVFPASTRAAVHAMRMTIRDQVIEAHVEEKKKAQASFESAKKSGKNAALLEEQRPNVFTMKVANVMPGDRIEVSLSYSENLVPDGATYEFVYPTVVGPRYSNQPESAAKAGAAWVKSPFLPEGRGATQSFTLSASVSSAIPVAEIQSPSHAIEESWVNPSLVGIKLKDSEKQAANRDFVLRYRLAGDQINSGLSLYDAGDEKFFLLTVEPPARVAPEQIPPREFVFVVDVSGSMYGFPLDTAKTLLHDLVSELRPSDRFNVILFSGDSKLLSPKSLPATRDNIARAVALIDAQRGGGGTELLPALEQALTLTPEAGISRSFVVVTDGYVEADRQAMDYVHSHLGDANVFSFGIGSSVNRYLMEGLAHAGLGEAFVVTEPAEAGAAAKRFRDYVKAPVLTDVRVAYDGFDVYDVEPRAIPDVLAERPVVVFGKWRGKPAGSVRVAGVSGKGAYAQQFAVADVTARNEDRALRYLWARTRIASLSDFGFGELGDKEKSAVTALGIRYNLLTQYTSFVAVANTVRNPGGVASESKQPSPLPLGVSANAIGNQFGTAAEPELFWLLALLLAGWGATEFRARRRAQVAS